MTPSRKAFEEAYKAAGGTGSLDRYRNAHNEQTDTYCDQTVRGAWIGWLMRGESLPVESIKTAVDLCQIAARTTSDEDTSVSEGYSIHAFQLRALIEEVSHDA